MSGEISKVYEPDKLEKLSAQKWQQGNYFHANPQDTTVKGKKPYTIVIPPPNVTAALHLGHALNNTLQDILIRYKRMSGCNTLWMPGTDHAGIATQTVVEKALLAKHGKRRTDFERKEFISHVQAWKDEFEERIINQLKSVGCSCDWQRTRFTMDAVCAKSVRSIFHKLFEDDLIYRGKRLVNWDPATQTVLADDEVEHETVQGFFWYMKYPLVEPVEVDGEKIEFVTVATTRPETMLGDTAIAMNPSDPRAKALVGKMVRLPIVGRKIPIIADLHVVLPDPDSDDEKAKFSTGFLKVTPAHDPNDWEIGLRHNLPVINVMAPDGTISEEFGWKEAESDISEDANFVLGLDRFEARQAIIQWFKSEKLLAEIRDYTHEVGHSYRSHVPIEPYLSDQWYIAVKKPIASLAEKFGTGLIDDTDVPKNSLAGLALKPLLDGKLKFTPTRYSKNYSVWLENLRDWPISRQLWWGHQIPVWLCDDCQKYSCGIEDITTCQKCGSKNVTQDPDVLDTWFSSALWPFSTLGWPENSPELETYYPGDVLCTAREIITLWVSRMVMMGQYCLGEVPFKDVYIHAMIQDGKGRKMSKSLGNGIDPLVVIDSHGADSMRFTLASMTTDTQDVRMPVEPIKLPDGRTVNSSPKFDVGRNFCNKLWNASRFAMMNLEGTDPDKFDKANLKLTDKWILSRLAKTIKEVTDSLDSFKFNEPITAIYKFFWNDFCDWYLEWSKPRMLDTLDKPIAQNVLAFVLDSTLRLLHPFTPFITEAIYDELKTFVPDIGLKGIVSFDASDALIVAPWPDKIDSLIDETAESDIATIQNFVRSIREIRSQYNIAPSKKLNAFATGETQAIAIVKANSGLISKLASLASLDISEDIQKPDNAATVIVQGVTVFVADVIDKDVQRKSLEKQKDNIENQLKGVTAKLANENFISRAKPQVVQQAKDKLDDLTQELQVVNKHLGSL